MPTWKFKLLYDRECPFCRGEVEWLKRRDRAGRLAFEDITAADFDPSRYHLTHGEVMGVMHGVRPDGTLLSRMEAVREAYRTVGLGWLLWPTRLPVLRTVSDCLYGLFARNRQTWGKWLGRGCPAGKCDVGTAAARVPNRSPTAR